MRIKKKSLAGRILAVLCALVVLAAAVKVVLVNVKYPEPREVPIQKGETVTFLGLDITYTETHIDTLVNTCQWLGIDVPLAFYASYYMGEDSIEDMAAFCMRVTLQNNTTEEQVFDPILFSVMQGDFATNVDYTLFTAVNDGHYVVPLEPGETKECLLTYALFAYRFSEERWANILDLDYTVLFGYYPDKIYFVA